MHDRYYELMTVFGERTDRLQRHRVLAQNLHSLRSSEAVGTPQERMVFMQWISLLLHEVDEPGRTTTFSYHANGNLDGRMRSCLT